MEWNKKTNNFVRLNEIKTRFKRLDRIHLQSLNNTIKKNITEGKYTDYHCLRPMNKYYDINWKIYKLLCLLI